MIYVLSKSFTFEASHLLPLHDGKCRNLHGHTWRVELEFVGVHLAKPPSPKAGMLVDFCAVGLIAAWLHDHLDHKHLNELLEDPTSERLAAWIAEQVPRVIDSLHLDEAEAGPLGRMFNAVTVQETATSKVRLGLDLSR